MTRLTYNPTLVAVIVIVASVVNCTPDEPDIKPAPAPAPAVSPKNCTKSDYDKLEDALNIGKHVTDIKANGLTKDIIDKINTTAYNCINETLCSVNEKEKMKQQVTIFVNMITKLKPHFINSTVATTNLNFLTSILPLIEKCMNSTGTTTKNNLLSIVFSLTPKPGRENCGNSKAIEECLLNTPEVKEKDTMNLIGQAMGMTRKEMNCTEPPKPDSKPIKPLRSGASYTSSSYNLGVLSALLAAGAYWH